MRAMTSLRALVLVHAAAVAACGGAVARADAGDAGAPAADDAPAPAPRGGACSAPTAAGVEVASVDLNAYPPYAIAGCALVYVSPRGALVMRDLATGAEATLSTIADEHPRRPAISDALVAWEATIKGKDVIRIWPRSATPGEAPPATIDRFAQAREPRVAGNAVVFTAWNGPTETDDTDVYLFDSAAGEPRLVLGGRGQQRFADVSSDAVAVTDFSEDPDGTFNRDDTDLADVVLVDRATGAVTRRPLPGKQAFPLLVAGDRLAYLHWGEVHPEPKFSAFQIRVGARSGGPADDLAVADVRNASTDYVRVAAADGLLEWISSPDGRTKLFRAPSDGSRPPVAVAGLDGLLLYGPASSGAITVLAAAATDGTAAAPRLRALER